MELGLLLTLGCISAPFLILGFYFLFMINHKMKNYTSEAIGCITNFQTDSDSSYPIYEYDVNGNHYIGKATSNSFSKRYIIGDQVKINYDPNDPKKSYLRERDEKTYKVIGLIFICIGCIPMIILNMILFRSL